MTPDLEITAFKRRSGNSTRSQLLALWRHLNRRRRIQFGLLFVVMLVCGGAELVSLGAVLPLLAVLNNPEQLWQQPLVSVLAPRLGLSAANQLLLPAALTFAAVVILASLIRLANLWLSGKLAAVVGSDLSCEAYRRTLYQPYAVHLQRNSAEVITGTTQKIARTIAALNSFLQLLTAVVVALGLLTGLLLIDASVALIATGMFATTYGVVAFISRYQLRNNGHLIVTSSTKQIKALQEGLGSIRDVILDGSQLTYLRTYRQADLLQRQLEAKSVFIGSAPRFAVEALGLVAIASLGYFSVTQRGSGVAVIPLLGAMALGAQRLLPALQQIYFGWASLKNYNSAIEDVLNMLNQPLPSQFRAESPLKMLHGVELENVYFSYGSDQPEVLKGFSISIHLGECVGLIGSTGSGKSTMVDLLMGLLEPKSGKVLIDGEDLYDPMYPERLLAWRAAIAHVPQNVYLSDSSFAENIAFGVPVEQIDLDRVKHAARQAQISNFIEDSVNSYQNIVGERGVRISGGQRQRIGIARALYKQAPILVLDEATSALDGYTENAVMAEINQLSKELTIIIIAHRLSTVQRCDRVIKLANGIVSAEGSPRQILPGMN